VTRDPARLAICSHNGPPLGKAEADGGREAGGRTALLGNRITTEQFNVRKMDGEEKSGYHARQGAQGRIRRPTGPWSCCFGTFVHPWFWSWSLACAMWCLLAN
jgi:hypothetical protein